MVAVADPTHLGSVWEQAAVKARRHVKAVSSTTAISRIDRSNSVRSNRFGSLVLED